MQIHDTNVEMRREGNFLNKLFCFLFYTHLALISVLVIFLTVRGILSTKNFQPKEWYLLVLSSTACAGIIGFSWQAFLYFNPSRTLKATFWLSPLLTCAFGVLLVAISTKGSLAASVIVLIFSILQSLYACWVTTPRLQNANKILTVSIAYHPLKVKTSVILSIIITTLYSSFLMAGIGGATATGTKIDTLFIFLILGSMTWTTQIIKNMIQVTVSHIKYMHFTCGIEVDFLAVVKSAAKYSMGSICIGSIIIPVFDVIRGSARAVNLISGDVDEFMFSCTNCCSGVASRIVAYGNRWGFVHVGVYNKEIVQASMDTWNMFRRVGIEKLINMDLTSSLCFLSGVGAGSICALLGGTWALVIDRRYATEVCLYAFLNGYFMVSNYTSFCFSLLYIMKREGLKLYALQNRVAMTWVQASVMAYYVAYAENPQSQQFENIIPAYMQELERSQV